MTLAKEEAMQNHFLANFDIKSIINRYGCQTFVETGTGQGKGIDFALTLPFKKIFSIEIIHQLALSVAMRHVTDHRITIIHGKSERALAEVLEEISAKDPVMFFLDARWPGAEYGLKPFDGERNLALRFPLQTELEFLAKQRDLSKDIFLINELRIYEKMHPMPLDRCPPVEMRNSAFIEKILGKTHRLERYSNKEHRLCATPI